MGKSYIFSVLFLVSGIGIAQSQPLIKIIFYPETPHEQHYNFNTQGYLSDIRKSDGTMEQEFVYDVNNNLIESIRYNSAGLPTSFTITYDANNRMTQAGTMVLTYDPSFTRYIYDPEYTNEYEYLDYTHYDLTEEGLLNSQKSYFVAVDVENYMDQPYQCYYNNGNLIRLALDNFNHSRRWEYVYFTNPLKNAMLPILKTMGIVDNSYSSAYLRPDFCSSQLVSSVRYELEDPESSQFIYQFNANNLPIKKSERMYYFNTLEMVRTAALYYYAGDEIPQ